MKLKILLEFALLKKSKKLSKKNFVKMTKIYVKTKSKLEFT